VVTIGSLAAWLLAAFGSSQIVTWLGSKTLHLTAEGVEQASNEEGSPAVNTLTLVWIHGCIPTISGKDYDATLTN